jgi:hypothetical protein
MTVDPQELIAAESAYLESLAETLRKRANELRDLLKDGRDEGLISKLEALPWVAAKSGKCDFLRDAPPQLVTAVRASKNGIRGPDHHFTAAADSLTLFRFARKEAKTT